MNVVYMGESGFSNFLLAINLEKVSNPLYSDLSSFFYKKYWKHLKFNNLSFAIVENDRWVCVVLITLQADDSGCGTLNYYGLPMLYMEAPDLSRPQRKKIETLLRQELLLLVQKYQCKASFFEEIMFANRLSPLGLILLEMGGRAEPSFTQVLDLTQEETTLWRQVRKSYKGEISWGRKNLDLLIVDVDNINDEYINMFRKLHCEAAGRETRSEKTWEIQRDMIKAGEAFVVLGWLNNQLVTAAMFIHSQEHCYYGVSASDRMLFDKPLAHAVVWTGILSAKGRGCHLFELGEQFYPKQLANEEYVSKKMINIGRFKRGFGGETLVRLKIRNNFG